MYQLRKGFENNKGIRINLKNKNIYIKSNGRLSYEDFNLLISEGYSFIFDFTKPYIDNAICKDCGENKDIKEFALNRRYRNNHERFCKKCSKERIQKRKKENSNE